MPALPSLAPGVYPVEISPEARTLLEDIEADVARAASQQIFVDPNAFRRHVVDRLRAFMSETLQRIHSNMLGRAPSSVVMMHVENELREAIRNHSGGMLSREDAARCVRCATDNVRNQVQFDLDTTLYLQLTGLHSLGRYTLDPNNTHVRLTPAEELASYTAQSAPTPFHGCTDALALPCVNSAEPTGLNDMVIDLTNEDGVGSVLYLTHGGLSSINRIVRYDRYRFPEGGLGVRVGPDTRHYRVIDDPMRWMMAPSISLVENHRREAPWVNPEPPAEPAPAYVPATNYTPVAPPEPAPAPRRRRRTTRPPSAAPAPEVAPAPAPPPARDTGDEIDLLTAGTVIEVDEIDATPIIDFEVRSSELHRSMTELISLLAEAVVEISPDNMLHAELVCSLEEARLLLSRCAPSAPNGRVEGTNPWGGARRVRSADDTAPTP